MNVSMLALYWSRGTVMQYKVFCLRGEVGSGVILSISNLSKAGGWVFVCYLVSFYLELLYAIDWPEQ